jgi:queuine/archaeosine tRNA-ribosyltransferase
MLRAGNNQLLTPTYFPAVSGTCPSVSPENLIELISSFSYPRILVSCYDIDKMATSVREKALRKLSSLRKNGSFSLIDSGVFEAYWKVDTEWDFQSYKRSLSKIKPEVYFSFDIPPGSVKTKTEYFQSTLRMIEASKSLVPRGTCAPIVHGSNPKELLAMFKHLNDSGLGFEPIVAIAERDCGSSISERARTISRVRGYLDGIADGVLLHILGCGDPISMALFVASGADSFDSLDWTESVLDRDGLRTRNFFQLELVKCNCRICKMKFLSPVTRTLLHNLLFYQDYVLSLKEMVRRNTLGDFLLEYVGRETLRKSTLQR